MTCRTLSQNQLSYHILLALTQPCRQQMFRQWSSGRRPWRGGVWWSFWYGTFWCILMHCLLHFVNKKQSWAKYRLFLKPNSTTATSSQLLCIWFRSRSCDRLWKITKKSRISDCIWTSRWSVVSCRGLWPLTHTFLLLYRLIMCNCTSESYRNCPWWSRVFIHLLCHVVWSGYQLIGLHSTQKHHQSYKTQTAAVRDVGLRLTAASKEVTFLSSNCIDTEPSTLCAAVSFWLEYFAQPWSRDFVAALIGPHD